MPLAMYNKGLLFSGKWEANIPDFYDAFPVDPSSPLLSRRNSSYPVFLIQAKLGVGPPEKIEKIDVNFQFISLAKDKPIQIIVVGPSEKF
jgi:hypothetical protein